MSAYVNHLLLVEDDMELSEMMREFLASHGYHVSVEANGLEAINCLRQQAFDAVILDIGLPGVDGFQVCQSVRPHFSGPIIVLTARGDEADEVVALQAGADDFMSKPVRPHALLARLKIHLRRFDAVPENSGDPNNDNPPPADLVVGALRVNLSGRNVYLNDHRIDLTTAEFDLLEYLARHAGSVVSRKQLYVDLLEIPYDVSDRSVDLRVSRLRRKLGDDPQKSERIKSVRGIGYLFVQ